MRFSFIGASALLGCGVIMSNLTLFLLSVSPFFPPPPFFLSELTLEWRELVAVAAEEEGRLLVLVLRRRKSEGFLSSYLLGFTSHFLSPFFMQVEIKAKQFLFSVIITSSTILLNEAANDRGLIAMRSISFEERLSRPDEKSSEVVTLAGVSNVGYACLAHICCGWQTSSVLMH